MKLHYRFSWRLIRNKKDVKFDLLAWQHLSPVSLRNPDQLRQARCPTLKPIGKFDSPVQTNGPSGWCSFLTGFTNRSILIPGRPESESTIVLTA